MIRINLLGEKKDNTAIYALQTLILCSSVIIVFLGCFAFHGSMSSELDTLTQTKQDKERIVIKLREKTKKVDDLEQKKQVLAEKLATIARLKVRKQGPVRVLDDLTSAIPERAWLLSLSQKGDLLQFNGIALDNQTVSDFMRRLDESKYFEGVDLISTRQYMRDSVKLQQFSLSAKLSNMLIGPVPAASDPKKSGKKKKAKKDEAEEEDDEKDETELKKEDSES